MSDNELEYLQGQMAALTVVMSLAIRLQMSLTSAERDAIIRNLSYLRTNVGDSKISGESTLFQSGFVANIEQVEQYLLIELPGDL